MATAAAWRGAVSGGVGRGERGGDSCVSGSRKLAATAVRVGEMAIGAAAVLPAHLPMMAGRKVADLKGATLLLVERDGQLVGLVDQRALVQAPDDVRLEDAMRRLDVCLTPATPLARARDLFLRTGAAALPVAAGAFLLGVVSRTAVERALRDLERFDVSPARAASRPARVAAEPGIQAAARRKAA